MGTVKRLLKAELTLTVLLIAFFSYLTYSLHFRLNQFTPLVEIAPTLATIDRQGDIIKNIAVTAGLVDTNNKLLATNFARIENIEQMVAGHNKQDCVRLCASNVKKNDKSAK